MWPNHWRASPLLLCLVVVIAPDADSQVLTGQLTGVVKDDSQAVLPDAAVTVTSPALLAGASTTTTNRNGAYRFPVLPPGIYSIRIAAAGFESYREEGVRIVLGGTVNRHVTLPVSGVAEQITVSAEGSMLDTSKVGVSFNYGTESIENTPRLRTDVSDFVKIAPGMSATNPSGSVSASTVPFVSSFGSSVNENAYVVDGAVRTGLEIGGAPFLDTDTIEEIEIVPFGVSAEYGNLQGAVINIVTRNGGNNWRSDASYYHQSPSLTAQSEELDCRCSLGQTAITRRHNELTAHTGGPLLEDRLWVFGGYQFREIETSRPGRDPRFPLNNFQHRLSTKLNWQMTPRLTLTQTFQRAVTEIPEPGHENSPDVILPIFRERPFFTVTRLSHVLDEDTLLDVQFSADVGDGDAEPENGDRSLAHRVDLATDVESGGAYLFGRSHSKRLELRGKLSHYAEDFLGGDHDFKFGVQFTHGSFVGTFGYPGGAYYLDYAGAPYAAYFANPFTEGGSMQSLGVFVDDVFHVGERLTVNLGLRFDRNEAFSPDVPALDKEANVFHPANPPRTTALFDPATGQYSDIIDVFDPLRGFRFDRHLRPPNTDQFSVGIDREFWRDTAVGVSYVRKVGRGFTGFEDVGGIYGTEDVTLEDGRTLSVFPLLNSPSERLFLLTNPEEYFLHYYGLLLTLDKRWSRGWQALISYTLSEATGMLASSGPRPEQAQFSQGTFRGRSLRDPNDFTNAEGKLANDRTHMFRAHGVVEIPNVGVIVAANFQYLSGKPWAASTNVRLPQGRRSILVEPPGSRRLPAQTLLDLRVSKIFRFQGDRKLELLALCAYDDETPCLAEIRL